MYSGCTESFRLRDIAWRRVLMCYVMGGDFHFYFNDVIKLTLPVLRLMILFVLMPQGDQNGADCLEERVGGVQPLHICYTVHPGS